MAKEPRPWAEFLTCYWGTILNVLGVIVQLAAAVWFHSWWNVIAAGFITVMAGFTLHWNRLTKASRVHTRQLSREILAHQEKLARLLETLPTDYDNEGGKR